MEKRIKEAIEQYQCPGCVCGSDTECFSKSEYGLGCSKHVVGTMALGTGHILLGMPNGFNKVSDTSNVVYIYEKYSTTNWEYDRFNIPVWKYLNNEGHTIVRGVCPRTNYLFVHIFLENCVDKVNCLEITNDDVEGMD